MRSYRYRPTARLTMQHSAPSAWKLRSGRLELGVTAQIASDAALRIVLCLSSVVACLLGSTSPAQAALHELSAPSQPHELRVVSMDAYQISLSWEASSDNTGPCTYLVHVSDGRQISVAEGTTSVRLSWGSSDAASYRFSVVAVDESGNRSSASNRVSVTRAFDHTAPSVPSPALLYVGSDRVALTWNASDEDGPSVLYEVSVNGRAVLSDIWATTATIPDLRSDAHYALSLRARDAAGNWSAPSAILTVQTQSHIANDVTPPTTPSAFVALEDYCGDVFLVWNESLDDRDAAADLEYAVYVNGSLQQTVAGRGWAAFMIEDLGPTELSVVAVDSAGNASLPAFATLDLDECEP